MKCTALCWISTIAAFCIMHMAGSAEHTVLTTQKQYVTSGSMRLDWEGAEALCTMKELLDGVEGTVQRLQNKVSTQLRLAESAVKSTSSEKYPGSITADQREVKIKELTAYVNYGGRTAMEATAASRRARRLLVRVIKWHCVKMDRKENIHRFIGNANCDPDVYEHENEHHVDQDTDMSNSFTICQKDASPEGSLKVSFDTMTSALTHWNIVKPRPDMARIRECKEINKPNTPIHDEMPCTVLENWLQAYNKSTHALKTLSDLADKSASLLSDLQKSSSSIDTSSEQNNQREERTEVPEGNRKGNYENKGGITTKQNEAPPKEEQEPKAHDIKHWEDSKEHDAKKNPKEEAKEQGKEPKDHDIEHWENDEHDFEHWEDSKEHDAKKNPKEEAKGQEKDPKDHDIEHWEDSKEHDAKKNPKEEAKEQGKEPKEEPKGQEKDPKEQEKDPKEQEKDPKEQGKEPKEQEKDPKEQGKEPKDHDIEHWEDDEHDFEHWEDSKEHDAKKNPKEEAKGQGKDPKEEGKEPKEQEKEPREDPKEQEKDPKEQEKDPKDHDIEHWEDDEHDFEHWEDSKEHDAKKNPKEEAKEQGKEPKEEPKGQEKDPKEQEKDPKEQEKDPKEQGKEPKEQEKDPKEQ
ncbi:unnamed protein product, partial [Trypanosoma congolense IL3000]